MRGSIAIWHDTLPNDADGYAPRVEIHVNIWRGERRHVNRGFDLFDIGFRFEERSLRTLSISLPFVIEDQYVSDLFDLMHDTPTLSAIFNETLTAGELQENGQIFAASHTERKRVQFFVARCPVEERRLSTIGDANDACSVITLNDAFFDRLRNRVGDHYFRLRIKVPIGTENGFVASVRPKDSAFLSTISTSEIVEFRLNERRNFSQAIREKLQASHCSLIDISSVHYFLVRDMRVEMTQSHTAFKKMRRLEPFMWRKYLTDTPELNPENMIIYHWNSMAITSSAVVESFTALATFRAYYTGSLWIYGAVIVALGAAGSALQALAAAVFGSLVSAFFLNAALIGVLVGILIIVVFWRRRKL